MYFYKTFGGNVGIVYLCPKSCLLCVDLYLGCLEGGFFLVLSIVVRRNHRLID